MMVNQTVFEVLVPWLNAHPDPKPSAPLFRSCNTEPAITVPHGIRTAKQPGRGFPDTFSTGLQSPLWL